MVTIVNISHVMSATIVTVVWLALFLFGKCYLTTLLIAEVIVSVWNTGEIILTVENQSTGGKNLSHCHSLQQKSHMDWAGIKPWHPQWGVPPSNLGPETGYYDRGSSHSLQANAETGPQIMPQQLPSTHLAIH
jgi:hypothetical protein